jgi:putative protein kinase ArgK-like GTPase of G3E family
MYRACALKGSIGAGKSSMLDAVGAKYRERYEMRSV